ncbi:hypothetical protein BBP00_00005626 [Phytophthora kernoviae]|uniref:Uncharacterized protein n=1 Tax=Phytophthora kernoviae TaxID=325452 RepID=A0A3F2RP14_9STRA|nr:hypothetical protein BBP00_00005626 [Phytophthora kernoviae]
MPTDTTSSALTPVSFENLAAIEAKLTSVEFELQRYSVDKTTGTKKQSPQRPNTPGRSSNEGKSVSTTGSVDPADPEPMNFESQQEVMTLNRTRVVFDKETVAPWTMKMPIAKATGHSPVVKKQREPVDFHLSSVDLPPPRSRSSDAASPKSNQREVGQYQHHSKTKASSPAVDDGPLKTPKYAKHDVCDLSYLDNFRSYTV